MPRKFITHRQTDTTEYIISPCSTASHNDSVS